ncbi:hypothetical protein ACWJJH_03100 [Endozoicomonadaceae bacterium StTr2]
MAYNFTKWKERMSNRSDMSSSLVHLTRSAVIDGKRLSTVDVLLKILRERKIKGSDPESAFICGDERAVCLQDAPLYSVAQNLDFEKKFREENHTRFRYSGCGLVFAKYYLFGKGCRPVIYDIANEAKEYTNEENWFRIVSLDLSDLDRIIDWSHEREWRIKGDLEFDPASVGVLLGTRDEYREFMQKAALDENKDIVDEVCGIIVLSSLTM